MLPALKCFSFSPAGWAGPFLRDTAGRCSTHGDILWGRGGRGGRRSNREEDRGEKKVKNKNERRIEKKNR